MEKLTHIVFAFGPGGWVKTSWRRGDRERTEFVRFEPQKRGGWVIAELRVKNPTAANLREIPLHRIAVAFNALEMSEELRDGLEEAVPADLDGAMRAAYNRRPRRNTLKRPPGRKLSEEFFRSVAITYREAIVRGLNPVMTVAEDAGVPHSTAARWIAQARDKKFLPPAQRGKVAV